MTYLLPFENSLTNKVITERAYKAFLNSRCHYWFSFTNQSNALKEKKKRRHGRQVCNVIVPQLHPTQTNTSTFSKHSEIILHAFNPQLPFHNIPLLLHQNHSFTPHSISNIPKSFSLPYFWFKKTNLRHLFPLFSSQQLPSFSPFFFQSLSNRPPPTRRSPRRCPATWQLSPAATACAVGPPAARGAAWHPPRAPLRSSTWAGGRWFSEVFGCFPGFFRVFARFSDDFCFFPDVFF